MCSKKFEQKHGRHDNFSGVEPQGTFPSFKLDASHREKMARKNRLDVPWSKIEISPLDLGMVVLLETEGLPEMKV